MNWINPFEVLRYFIASILLINILKDKNYRELDLLIFGVLTGFTLGFLAVCFTNIYHYSNDFYISTDFEPYQFPSFEGLMWGGITVCALRITERFSLPKMITTLISGWLVVSMDLVLDVVVIRLDGGFWVWEGRPIALAIDHQMSMSVIWVNFLGYMFEVPSIVYMALKSWEKDGDKTRLDPARSICTGLGGVVSVGFCSLISLFLNKISHEWFAFVVFLGLWSLIFISFLAKLLGQRKRINLTREIDWPVLVFWLAIYGYYICGLVKLGIMRALPIYGAFALFLCILALVLALVDLEEVDRSDERR